MVDTEKFKMHMKTITPVYIGTGDVYMSSEYFLDTLERNNNVYPIFQRINLTKYFNSLDKNNQNNFSKNLLNPKYKLPKVKDEYVRYFAYNKCSARPNPGKEIHENIKVLDKPYIPGSSIKGALENAILYNALDFNDIKQICKGNRINDAVIKKFFSPSGNPQNSIMRFLQIGDSTVAVRPYIYDIQTIKVNRNKPFSNQMKLFYETIVAKELISNVTTNFDIEMFEKLNLENKKELIEIDFIKKSLYEFSKDYIEHEIKFSEKYGIDKSRKFYKSLKKMNSIDSPVLRLGATTGLFSTTVNLKIKSYGFDYFNKVKRNIKGRKAQWEYPVTRRIINSSKHPPGWMQLSFEEN